MCKTFIYFFKRFYKLLILPLALSITLFVLGSIRTNKALILKGDTSIFTTVVNIDTNYEVKGSFSTIYVQTMEKSTALQNLLVKNMKTVESYEMSEASQAFSDIDSYTAGKIQYNSSIGNSIVLAYKEAMKKDSSIKLEYSFSGFDITYYGTKSQFKVGDRVIAIKAKTRNYIESTISDEMDFRSCINETKTEGDIYTIIRNGNTMDITITKDDGFSAYSIYDIDYAKTIPSMSISSNMIGGPSGGLLQTLSIYNQLVEEDLTHGLKIAGTGTISYTGKVGAIGGIREKIPTAIDDHIDVFFCMEENYSDALEAYNSTIGHEKMKLICISTFYDALEYLMEGYKNDFRSN